jgi:hypothetical protein
MKQVELYRHPKMTDVALQILSQENLGTDRQEVCVMWWNIGVCHEPWCMNVIETIKPRNEWMNELYFYLEVEPS